MRKCFLIITIALLALLSSQSIYGQTETKKESKIKLGLGTTFYGSNYNSNGTTSLDISEVSATIDICKKIRVEPSFGFYLSKDYNSYDIGIGVFGIKSLSKFNLLYGARITGGSSMFTTFAPAIGAEYFLIDRFSIGTEIQLGLVFNDQRIGYTNTAVKFRFYFN